MPDVFDQYEQGLTQMLERLSADHPHYEEALTFQSRLLENIAQVRQYSDSENLRSERNRILGQLNRLALAVLEESFNDLCAIQPGRADVEPATLFIAYKRDADPDQRLADYLHAFLTDHGHRAFIDEGLRAGEDWLERIDRQIKASDFLIVLLSRESADSEMVQAEVRRAYEHRRQQGHPRTLPVRIAYEGPLPYSIDFFLNPLHYVVWRGEGESDSEDMAENQRVGREILAAIEAGRLPEREPVQFQATASGALALSEDGRPVADIDADTFAGEIHPPLPEFDPRFVEQLPAPGGAVKLRDRLYVERDADARLRREVVKRGSTTTIRAARQTGKSSLLVRGVHHARGCDAQVVCLDLQRVDPDHLETPDAFLRYLAEFVARKLRLGVEVAGQWQSYGAIGPQDKLTYLIEDHVLDEDVDDSSIVLAIDEADRLLQTGFHQDIFALIRSWHNSRAFDERWDRLNIVLVISTEPYLLIPDVTQSPFNVGLTLYLEDFDREQVRDLNRRHGSPVRETDFPYFLALFGGHPYLTRKALYTLVAGPLAWDDLVREAASDHGPFGDHLRHHMWLLRDEPVLREALAQIIHHDRCEDDMTFFRLLRAGLVKGSGAVCRCRCELYRMYFEGKL
jgi:hypothetical protein